MNRKIGLIAGLVLLIILIGYPTYPQNSAKSGINIKILDRASAQELADKTAFPEDEAGLAAYVNLGPLDFEKILSAAEKTISILKTDSKSYIYGTVTISGSAHDASWKDTVYIYVDTNGWLVAFFPRDYPSSALIYWSSNSKISSDNTLERALKRFMDNLGADFSSAKPYIKYYHFGYPEATDLLYFVAYGSKKVSFLIPEDKEIFEVSYNILDDCHGDSSSIKIQHYYDGSPKTQQIASVDSGRKVGLIKEEPIESTEEFTKPGGLEVGETFIVTVKYYPILDRNGDGVVNANDISLDTSSVSVTEVDARFGKVTLRVEQYSPVNTTFKLTYTGSKIYPIYPGTLYELEQGTERGYRELSSAIVFIYK